ncbi:MAG: hypothetical protein V4584_05120 [Verrucomicrobiota bacterium]
MKKIIRSIVGATCFYSLAFHANGGIYSNFIRQVQFPTGTVRDATGLAAAGQRLSELAIDPGGARFELWTVDSSTSPLPTSYLLDSNYVGTYIPIAEMVIRSEDGSAATPRTRADRPFYVDVTITGLLAGPTDPEPSKSVKFLRHVQSYGIGGTGVGIDRTQASLVSQSAITTNGTQNLTFLVNAIPGANRAKVRGEERFSVFSLEDYQAPESQIASQTIQVWPVADGTITGITANQSIRFMMPNLTIGLNDLYPNSTTYAQAYKGNAQLGTTGKILPGSGLVVSDSVPQSRVLTVSGYDKIFDSDGRWTIEILTVTPFGVDRLAHVSFDVDRTIEVNGSFTTIE